MVEVYTSVPAGRTVPGARRVRICVLFNVIDPYTHTTSRVDSHAKDVQQVPSTYIKYIVGLGSSV